MCTIARTFSCVQLIAYGKLDFSTTIVFGFACNTALINSSCSNVIDCRSTASRPSLGTDTFAHYHATHASVVGMLRFDPATDQLQGNVNADFGNAEFSVTLHDVAAVFGSDFVL